MTRAVIAADQVQQLPVGHEFWSAWWRDPSSTNTREQRTLYRVIGYRECALNRSGTRTAMLPELEAIDVEYR